MSKIKENAKVISQEMIADGIYSMWIETKAANYAKPGQFIDIYTKDSSKLLPRPISICEIEDNKLRIVYRVAGAGTKEFSEYKAGDSINILGPLGNGFKVSDKKAILIGGGIGIPPMLGLAKARNKENTYIVCGYRRELFLTKELTDNGTLIIATDDGSTGTKGTVVDAILANDISDAEEIYACGPMPMLKAVKAYAEEHNMKAWISLEEKMACGVGACLGCICKSKEIDDHSKVKNKRICTDGPVFDAWEVEL